MGSDNYLLLLHNLGEDRDDVHRTDSLPVLRGNWFRQVFGDESCMPLLPVRLVDKGHRAKSFQRIRGLPHGQRFDLILDLPAGLERDFPVDHNGPGAEVPVDQRGGGVRVGDVELVRTVLRKPGVITEEYIPGAFDVPVTGSIPDDGVVIAGGVLVAGMIPDEGVEKTAGVGKARLIPEEGILRTCVSVTCISPEESVVGSDCVKESGLVSEKIVVAASRIKITCLKSYKVVIVTVGVGIACLISDVVVVAAGVVGIACLMSEKCVVATVVIPAGTIPEKGVILTAGFTPRAGINTDDGISYTIIARLPCSIAIVGVIPSFFPSQGVS